ncbi:hypothetical protein DFQ30_004239 [Apophysomyces sp. BC1015]|nr:hypothetical protein DFQ30_004239 [Apophysomyces sp. BC1015]
MWDPRDVDFPTQAQLENLRYYKYAAEDKSFVSRYILRHYWNWAVTLFPTWIAPNLITLIGLGFMMFNVLLIVLYVPDLGADNTPQWLYFSFAAGLWLYSTLDNVDGKQARRTNTSSPLGELFDHGCDALNCTFVVLLQAAALGLGHSASTAILLVVTIIGFYLSTVEEYYTGVLYLGYVNGPTEGIIVSCLAFVWSGCFGASWWQQSAQELLPFLPDGLSFADVFVWGMVFFFLVTHCPMCFYAIYQACRTKSLSRTCTFTTIIYPFTSYSLAIYFWLSSPYSIIFKEQHMILFSLYFGLLFGLMASNIILAHLTRSEFPGFSSVLASPWFMVVCVNAPAIIGIRIISPAWEYRLLWAMFIMAFAYYSVWVKQADGSIGSVEEETEAESLLDAQENGSSQDLNNKQPSYNTFH